ncbi:MAG: hypothetical protein V7727_18675 [Sneathiella sp.]
MAKNKSGLYGAREASRLLRELPQAAEQRVLQAATMSGSRAWAKHIKGAAPVGDNPKSPKSQKYGPLKKNITVQALKSLRRKNQRGARVWTKFAFWGFIREFGSKRQAANPWFRPAADSGQGAALQAQAAATGRGIEREAKKLAAKFGIK